MTPPKPTTQPSTELDKIVNDIYQLGMTDALLDANDAYILLPKATKAILTLIEQAVLDGRKDELARLHTFYSKRKCSHYNPFTTIEERVATLNAQTNRLQGLSNKEKGTE